MNAAVAAAPLELSRLFDAGIEDLWRAWTDPALLARWFAPGTMRAVVTEFDARVGGRYRIEMHDPDDGSTHTVTGQFREVEAPERLVMSWAWERREAEVSTVHVQLVARGDRTEVSIRHLGLPDEETADKHAQGWQGCLANLEATLVQVIS